MAQNGIIDKVLVLAVFLFSAAAMVSAQGSDLAPAPSPDAGGAFSLSVSGALIGISLLFTFLYLLRN